MLIVYVVLACMVCDTWGRLLYAPGFAFDPSHVETRNGPSQRSPNMKIASSITSEQHSRRGALFFALSFVGSQALPGVAEALQSEQLNDSEKMRNLPPEKIAGIVRADLVERQFLATARFTRAIYDESATFTDEIDTYTLTSFVKGTSALFVPEKSKVRLVGDVVANDDEVSFFFDEDLCFNIPFQPVVTVTGKCVLSRDPQSGLITKYREYWDKSPFEVVLTAFNRP